MKKIFYLMSLLAFAFVACDKTPEEEVFKPEQTPDGLYVYKFSVTNEFSAWQAGDQLAVYKEDGSILGLADLDATSAGANEGAFSLTVEPLLADGTKLVFKYPFVEDAAIDAGKVLTNQTAAAGGAGVAANGILTADVNFLQKDLKVTLNTVNAYVKFSVSSTEFAEYTLNGITLWAAGADLSGDVTVGQQLTVVDAADYVKTTVVEPAVVGSGATELMLAALPADLSGKTVWAIVHMSKGNETVTLPVQITEAVALQAGAVKEIVLPALTLSDVPAWYEPKETRYIAAYGEGWSYGPENTALFANETPRTVEFKARGNFMKVVEPKSIKVAYASHANASKAGIVYIGGTDSYSNNAFQTFDLAADYTASISMKGNYSNSGKKGGHVSGLYVLDKAGNVIWGTNLWLTMEDLVAKQYTNGQVLTKNIGATWTLEENNHWTTCGGYFQWGRPFAFGWDNNSRPEAPTSVAEDNDLAKSASHPYTIYCYNGDPYDWYWGDGDSKDRSGDLDDLWGNPNPEATDAGVKSIFDPCPKGYRVVSPQILAEVETDLANKITKGTNITYVLHKEVSWGFSGSMTGALSGSNPGKNNNGQNTCLAYWANSNDGSNGRALWYFYSSSKEEWESQVKRAKGQAFPVRCMVDTENR